MVVREVREKKKKKVPKEGKADGRGHTEEKKKKSISTAQSNRAPRQIEKTATLSAYWQAAHVKKTTAQRCS
jgi:hypothetical protein